MIYGRSQLVTVTVKAVVSLAEEKTARARRADEAIADTLARKLHLPNEAAVAVFHQPNAIALAVTGHYSA